MKRTDLQVGLSLIGGMLALSGALLLTLISVPMLAHNDSPSADTLYVGTDGCYTCHIDADSLWSDDLIPRVIDNAVLNPHTAAIMDALPIGAEGDTLAYRVFDVETALPTNYRFGTYQGSLP